MGMRLNLTLQAIKCCHLNDEELNLYDSRLSNRDSDSDSRFYDPDASLSIPFGKCASLQDSVFFTGN